MKKAITIILIVLAVVFGIILAGYIYLTISSPHLFTMSENITQKEVRLNWVTLEDSYFISGMTGCENIYVDQFTMKVYVTDLAGYVHYLDGDTWDGLSIKKSKKIGTFVLGIDKGPDGYLYAGASEGDLADWMTTGGSVYRLDMGLNGAVPVTDTYPSLNGLTFDNLGNCFFASSNFDFFSPQGAVYVMSVNSEGVISEPRVFIDNAGLANGLYFDEKSNKVYLSNTVEGIFTFSVPEPELKPVYYKTAFLEAADDLCTDEFGRVWMTDPGPGGCAIKMFDPDDASITRYYIEGIGQTSSSRIRDGIIYITEIKKTGSMEYDGQGILVVPIISFDNAQ